MKKQVKITIKNEQYYGQDNSDIINCKTEGTVYRKRNKYYIIYNDENYDGALTSIKIDPKEESISIHRHRPELRQLFRCGLKTTGSYVTPYGKFELEIDTSLLDIKMDKKNGSLKLEYKLYLNKQYASQNYLNLYFEAT